MSVYITKDGIEDWWHKLPEGRHELGDITAIRVALASKSEALAEQPVQQQAGEPITQTFTGLPGRKLRDLLSAGWWVNGVCFQRTEEDGTVRRGAITTGGMVLWWNQPAQQQEPVAWATQMGEYAHLKWGAKRPEYPMVYEVPLYTSPPASKPLTDEQIWDEVKAADLDWQTGWSLDEDAANRYIIFARAIEAAHGIKE